MQDTETTARFRRHTGLATVMKRKDRDFNYIIKENVKVTARQGRQQH
jgi:hypothetical protein